MSRLNSLLWTALGRHSYQPVKQTLRNRKNYIFYKELKLCYSSPTLSKSYCAPLHPLPPPSLQLASRSLENKCTGFAVYQRLQTCKIYDLQTPSLLSRLTECLGQNVNQPGRCFSSLPPPRKSQLLISIIIDIMT